MWVKICGITRPEDAHEIAVAGASAIGLNFYRESKRYVTAERAIVIAEAARAASDPQSPIDVVGVFVNSPVDEVLEIVHRVSLSAVQFHGDESLEMITEFRQRMPELPVIRAIRVAIGSVDYQLAVVAELHREVCLSACLVDAFVAGEFGGTGVTIDPRIPAHYPGRHRLPSLVLAGGLTPQNVRDCISQNPPWGVDTASGVESSPGVKDKEKCFQFVHNASPAPERLTVRLPLPGL